MIIVGTMASNRRKGGGAPPSDETRFSVDGVEKSDGNSINLANGTTFVTIAALVGGSIEDLTGDSSLVLGDNPCTFTVRAEDGTTTLGVTINLNVTAATPTGFSVSGGAVEGEIIFTFDEVVDTEWLVSISPDSNFANVTTTEPVGFSGAFTTVAVDVELFYFLQARVSTSTSPDWSVPTAYYAYTAPHTVSAETRFDVNGVEHFNNDTINLASGTSSATISAVAFGSISLLTGNTSLNPGDNICTFTVTAEDGITTADMTITLHVLIAAPEGTLMDFSSVGGADFITAGPGLYITLYGSDGAGGEEMHYFWFNTGTESDPTPGGIGHEISVNPAGTGQEVSDAANDVIASISSKWIPDFSSTSPFFTVTDVFNEPRTDATSGTATGVIITVTSQGEDGIP